MDRYRTGDLFLVDLRAEALTAQVSCFVSAETKTIHEITQTKYFTFMYFVERFFYLTRILILF